MVTTITDPKVMVESMLRTNWTPGSTLGLTPTVHTGWYDVKSGALQVTVGEPDEAPGPTSGRTGFAFMMGDGSGPGQDRSGAVPVVTWVHRTMEGMSGLNPKKVTYLFMQEIDRIVMTFGLGQTGYDYVSVGNQTRLPPDSGDVPEDPTIWRSVTTVLYGWRKEP